MALRKWLIRSLYLAFLAAIAGAGLLVYSWIRPEIIITELTNQISEKFNDVDVEVQSAHVRILGGISVTDLRMIRRDDPTRTPFLQVPSAVLYHDKEKLNDGHIVIRKVEMFKPRFRLERFGDGRWNLTDILRERKDDIPAPLLVLHDATVTCIDRRIDGGTLAEWKEIEAAIVNDPLPVFTFKVRGQGKPSGPFAVEGRFDTHDGFNGAIDLPNVPIAADVKRVLRITCPETAEYAEALTGNVSAHLDLIWQPGPTNAPPAIWYDLRAHLTNGHYEHPALPSALENLDVAVHCKNGDFTLEKATASVGTGKVSVTMDLPKEPVRAPNTLPLDMPTMNGTPAKTGPQVDVGSLMDFEDRLRSVSIVATNVTVSPDLFQSLPGKAQVIKDMFKPSGPLNLNFSYQRREGGWKKTLVLEPLGMDATYRGFPYHLRNVRGTVRHMVTESTPNRIEIDLLADGAGATTSIKGTIKGTHPNVEVDLSLAGNGVTFDDELINAIPEPNPKLLRQLHATAHGDFLGTIHHDARIRREYGPEVYDNRFTIVIDHASMKYESFPYPLEEMSGTLKIHTVPDRPTQLPAVSGDSQKPQEDSDSTTLEFNDFRATHHGCRLHGEGRKDPAPGGSILALDITAESLPLDLDLREALKKIHMERSWAALDPSGRTNCEMWVKLYTRTDPDAELNAAEDLEMSMGFNGGSIRPSFFAYQLSDVAGKVGYAKGRVDLREFRGKHGSSALTLPYTEILFRSSGGYWADVRHARVAPLVVDQELLQALPPGMRTACEGMDLKGPMTLDVTRMVVDEQPGPYIPHYLPGAIRGAAPDESEKPNLPPPVRPPAVPQVILPTIYWDGCLTMVGASLKTGATWENIHGKLASWGLYKGDRMGPVRGNVVVDRATIAKQPVEAVTAQLRVDPRQPDVLAIPAIRCKFYSGDVGGEARVVFDSPPRYDLQLNAARVHLSEIARQYNLPKTAKLEGLASATVSLTNRYDERTGQPVLEGGGTIDVPVARLLNLPVLLNLVKVVKLHVPDNTGFEEAHSIFYIRGDRVKFGQLDLIGNAISLGGEGEMTLSGKDVHFEFYPVWTKLKEMFPLNGDWPGVVSKRFLKIKVTGEVDGKLDYKAEPVPGIVEPVKRVINRLK